MITIKKILVPVDFSGTGIKVLNQALVLAKQTDAEITLMTVLEDPFNTAGADYTHAPMLDGAKYVALIEEAADRRLKEIKAKMLKDGALAVDYRIEKGGTPYKRIVAVAEQINADLIMMGTHGVSGFREFVVGSNTFKVISEAKCPVLSIQRHTEKPGFKQIILPFRDESHSRENVDYAIGLAKIYGATLNILGISYDPISSGVNKIMLEAKQIKGIVEEKGVNCTIETVHGSYVAKLIFENAQRLHADLIVVMSDLDKMGISEFIAGPVIQQIVNHSKIPVLSIKPTVNNNMTNNEVGWSF
jgi:nucleotide-binding universal stress UspA family protein